MAIKEPVKTFTEAFNSSCAKNGIKAIKRNKPHDFIKVRGNKKNLYYISEDLTVKKEAKWYKRLEDKSRRKQREKILTPLMQRNVTIKWIGKTFGIEKRKKRKSEFDNKNKIVEV